MGLRLRKYIMLKENSAAKNYNYSSPSPNIVLKLRNYVERFAMAPVVI